MNFDNLIKKAYETRDVQEFLSLLFPPAWQGVTARIVETGVEFSDTMCPWAPRWSKIPPTERTGHSVWSGMIKSCIFRVHDCFHQLWGLPLPSIDFTNEDFYTYKRTQMCGEVAVLTLTEFLFCKHLWDTYPQTRELLDRRNAMQMLHGPLSGKSTLQVALRLDDLLHKKSLPKWVRDCKYSTSFVKDYVPMLELDRRNIDHNWKIMRDNKWRPVGAPCSRYSQNLDGLELTTWMINDFFHQCDTDSTVDESLRDFNRMRRSKIIIPNGWNEAK